MRIPLSLSSLFALLAPIAVVVAIGSLAEARPAPIQVRPGRIASPISGGASIGGQAAGEFSLLGVRAENLERNSERLILSYGDRFGQPQKGEPGYFHVALDRGSRRVVIDLAQITKTAVDPQRLSRILASSKLILGSEMTMDPQDGSTNITLNMKVPVKLKVATMNAQQARVVIELQPAPGEARQ